MRLFTSGCIHILIVLLLSTQAALAQSIRMVTEQSAPLQMLIDNKPSGFAVEFATRAAEKASLVHTISVLPWSSAYAEAQTKPNICIFSMCRTPAREALFKWSMPVASMQFKLYKRSARFDLSIANLEEAKRYKVVTVKDDVRHSYLVARGFKEGENLILAKDSVDALRLLAVSSVADFTILDYSNMPYRASEAGILPSRLEPVLDIPDFNCELWIAFSRETPDDIVSRFTRAAQALMDDGTFASLRTKWNLAP